MLAIQNNLNHTMTPMSYEGRTEQATKELAHAVTRESAAEAEPLTPEIAQQLVARLNKALDPFKTSLRFGVDNSSNAFFVSVVDTNTNEMIRRYPAEKIPLLMDMIAKQTGLLVDTKS